MNLLEYWWDCVKARWRGERRIAPRGVKGRVYQRVVGQGGNHIPILGKFKASIQPTGIYIAAEDKWYDLDKDGNRTPRRGPWVNKISRRK